MKYFRFTLLAILMLLLAACSIQTVEQYEQMEQQERSIVEEEQLVEEKVKESPDAEKLVENEPELEQPEDVTEQEVKEEPASEQQKPVEEKTVMKKPDEQKGAKEELAKEPVKELVKAPEKQKPVQEKPVQQETAKPVEPPAPKKSYVTIAIRVDSLLKHWDLLDPPLQSEIYVPSSGAILKTTKYELLSDKDSVWDVLLRATKEHKIQIEYQGANENIYNSVYVEGINHLYEFSAGPLSGWMYRVNGTYPNYGASQYKLKEGDVIEWHYTVDLGRDLGHYWEGE